MGLYYFIDADDQDDNNVLLTLIIRPTIMTNDIKIMTKYLDVSASLIQRIIIINGIGIYRFIDNNNSQ